MVSKKGKKTNSKALKIAKSVRKAARPKAMNIKRSKVARPAAKSKNVAKIKNRRQAVATARKLMAQKMEEQAMQEKSAEERKVVGGLIDNSAFASNVSKNVGTGAVDILKSLSDGPKTDEILAEKLSIKVNDVRRMLNAMNSYSIVRYDVNKDAKGWLLFTWRIDSEKLSEYVGNMNKEKLVELSLPTNCNDFFVCKACYDKEKAVLPFDSAFERGFTCNSCGKPFAQLSREETVVLFQEA